MTSEKEYYTKAEGIIKFIRILAIIALFAVLFMSFTIFKSEITFENLKYLLTYIEFSPPDFSDGEQTLRFSASEASEYAMLGQKLLVAEPEKVTIYDFSGHKIYGTATDFKKPLVQSNGKYALVYDPEGYSVSIFNSFSKVHDMTYKTPIESVFLDRSGGYAITTKLDHEAGTVIIYDKRHREIGHKSLNEAPIFDICLDTQSHVFAMTTLDVQNGDFFTKVRFHDLSQNVSEQILAELPGQLPLKMLTYGENVAIVSNLGINFFGKDRKDPRFISFGINMVNSVFELDELFAVVKTSAIAGFESNVSVYDYDGNVIFENDYKTKISDVSMKDGSLFVLEQFNLNIMCCDDEYNFADETISLPLDGGYKRVFAPGDQEYVLISHGTASKFTHKATEVESND